MDLDNFEFVTVSKNVNFDNIVREKKMKMRLSLIGLSLTQPNLLSQDHLLQIV